MSLEIVLDGRKLPEGRKLLKSTTFQGTFQSFQQVQMHCLSWNGLKLDISRIMGKILRDLLNFFMQAQA